VGRTARRKRERRVSPGTPLAPVRSSGGPLVPRVPEAHGYGMVLDGPVEAMPLYAPIAVLIQHAIGKGAVAFAATAVERRDWPHENAPSSPCSGSTV
jgi:hypothetical protein